MTHTRLYQYKCNECNEYFESSDNTPQCPKCLSSNCIKIFGSYIWGFSKGMKKLEKKGSYEN